MKEERKQTIGLIGCMRLLMLSNTGLPFWQRYNARLGTWPKRAALQRAHSSS